MVLMQAGYRRDPTESAKALKSKIKGKKRDSILYGAVIKQQRALSSLIQPKPPTPPTTGTPSMPGAPGAPVVFSNVNQISGGPLEASNIPAPPTSTPIRSQPMGPISAKMIQERLAGLKKHDDELRHDINKGILSKFNNYDQTIVKPTPPTKMQELEAMINQKKIEMKPVDTREPSVGINTLPTEMHQSKTKANPQSSTIASQSDISESSMVASAAPTVLASKKWDDPEVQALAAKLFNDFNAKAIKPQKSISISAYDKDGNGLGYKFQIYQSPNMQKYYMNAKAYEATIDDINLPDSIQTAITRIANDSLNTELKPGNINGLGFNESDPTKISSSRIAWMNSRDSGRKLPKGMIYAMGPSLLKGNLHIYNKSGRPIMSVSKISPAFQRIVRDTIERNTFDPQDYSIIEPTESADVNHFISISKPIAPSGIDRLSNADSIWKLKKRYEVLVGELSSGNDGLLVRQEMESILRSLMRMHAINPAKAKDLIKALHEY